MNSGTIETLFKDRLQENPVFPRTKTRAVTDDQGNRLDVILEDMVYVGDRAIATSSVPLDADTLGGKAAREYATEEYVENLIKDIQLPDTDTSIFVTQTQIKNYPTKEELSDTVLSLSGGTMSGNIDMSDNKLTGLGTPTTDSDAVSLGYVNQNFRPSDWMPNAADVEAAPAGFGLGEYCSGFTILADANDATLTGIYKMTSDTKNGLGVFAILEVIGYSTNYAIQRAYKVSTGLTYERWLIEGKWDEEWVRCDPAVFAPAGYGLGTRGETVVGDFDNYIVNGRWTFGNLEGVLHAPTGAGWGSLDVIASSNLIMQKVVCCDWSTNEVRWLTFQRVNTGNGNPESWSPWEFSTVPMTMGYEYRTAERYNGKAVYKKLDYNGKVLYRLDGETEWKSYSFLVDAAPAGYGLGTGSINFTDLSSITGNGWWLTNVDTPDGGWWRCLASVTNYDKGIPRDIVIDAWSLNGKYNAIRAKQSGTWGEWEWVNPPMTPGVEYRTTERYEGKPVYAYAISVGNLPNTTTVTYPVKANTATIKLVDIWGVLETSGKSQYDFTLGGVDIYIIYTGGPPELAVRTKTDMSLITGVAYLKYTK